MSQPDNTADELIFPSQAWFQEYQQRINDNEQYAEMGADWGVDFNGDFIFEMRGMPVDALDIDAMPTSLQEDIDSYVNDENGTHVGYAFLGLEGGKCTDARLVEDEDEVDVGFKLIADNDTWKQLMKGELGVVDGMMSGHFDIEGDMQKVMQYSQAAVQLTESASDIDAVYADDEFSS
jgi:putative sterol carrier protein